MRIAIIGDVGGHRQLLSEVLCELGVDLDAPDMPPDLVIIQVGDLIDRGPDSPGCVALADRLMTACPGQWIQLLGNHEGNRLGGPVFWDEELDAAARATLQDWWTGRRARLAIAIRSSELGEVLVSHGGLSATLWRALGEPPLDEVVVLLNSWVGCRPDQAFAAGLLLGPPNDLVGPAWADALTELYPSWTRATAVPFGQVHGHSTICDWASGRVSRAARKVIRPAGYADMATRHTRVDIGGRPFVGIDPTLGFNAAPGSLTPLMLEGELLA